MNIDCRVIGDLLPLYADESCSDASRALVDFTLWTRPRCFAKMPARMKSERISSPPRRPSTRLPSPTMRKRSNTVARNAAHS